MNQPEKCDRCGLPYRPGVECYDGDLCSTQTAPSHEGAESESQSDHGDESHTKIIPPEKKMGVGFLRQWLNEDRITDPKKMVTNEELLVWIDDVATPKPIKNPDSFIGSAPNLLKDTSKQSSGIEEDFIAAKFRMAGWLHTNLDEKSLNLKFDEIVRDLLTSFESRIRTEERRERYKVEGKANLQGYDLGMEVGIGVGAAQEQARIADLIEHLKREIEYTPADFINGWNAALQTILNLIRGK